MPTAYVILFLLLVLAIIFLAFPAGRSFLANSATRIRGRVKRPAAVTGVTVIDGAGDEYHVPAIVKSSLLAGQRQALRRSKRLLVSLLIILIGLLALWRWPGLLPNRLDRFTILIAPFNEQDGSISQAGRQVADRLTAKLAENGQLRALRISDPPADLNAALALMNREGADALVWGTITPGGMFDQESLTPMLAYSPTGAFAPIGWDGYSGRFAMPTFYTLADAPINGQLVLPDLFGALADYATDHPDAAFTKLGKLTENIHALAPALPYALRGNILWARGEYEQAAGEYRRALAQPVAQADESLPDPRPLLTNNLGAIQQDAGDPAAAATFTQTIKLLAGRDLGALRYNLGIGDLRAGKFGAAVSALEVARGIEPPSTPLLLTLSEAYRMASQFPQAEEALSAATQQVSADSQTPTLDLRNLTGNRLRGAVAEQHALLNLAEFLHARGPLPWELQASDNLPPEQLGEVREDLTQAVNETDALVQGWSRRSVTEDASEHPIGGLLAIAQFRRADALLRERRRWRDTVNIEIARTQHVEPPHGLAALWSGLMGDRSPWVQSRDDLKQLLDTQPNDVDAAVVYAEALMFSKTSDRATEWLDKATAAAPKRPEPIYGQALVAEEGGKHQRALELLAQAIKRDERYFPARLKLAEIAEATKQWPLAVEQRRWLARQRPSFENTLALAEALRNSGKAGYAEAERELLSLVNDDTLTDVDRVPALIELGRLYGDNKDWDAARTVLERAQRIAPRDPTVAYELGRVFVAQEDPASAKAQFQRAISNDPHPVLAHLALAKLYAENPDTPELTQDEGADAIARHYRAALDAGANDLAQLKLIGARLLEEGEYAAAADAYGRAVDVSRNAGKEDAEAHHGLARADLQIDRLDAAQAEEQMVLDLNDGYSAEALTGMGDIALRRGKPDEAVQQYNAALQRDENLTAAYIGLGRAAATAGNWAVAAAHFQRALTHDSRSAEAHFWLGEALLQQGDTNGAIAEYKQAIGIKKEYAEAYFGLARAQLNINHPKEAEESLATALKQRPRYAEALIEQGKLYEQQGKDSQAIDSYSKAIDANGKLAEAHYRRARLFIRQERMSEAERDLAAATGGQPNFPEAHYWLGRTYLAEDRAAAARDEFKTAVAQRNDNYPDARFYQGIAEEQLGQRAEALESFRIALEQGSDSAWAGDARAAMARLGNP